MVAPNVAKDLPTAGAIQGSGLLQVGVDAGKGQSRRLHIEGRGDKGLGHHDGHPGKGDFDVEPLEHTTQQPPAAKGQQQGYAGHGRRQDGGQVDRW